MDEVHHDYEIKDEDLNGGDDQGEAHQETNQQQDSNGGDPGETQVETSQQQPKEQKEKGKGGGPALPAETEEYLRQVDLELETIPESLHLVRALAERELSRIRAGEITEQGYIILHKDVPVKIVKKVCIPIKEHPKINFVGRLLGPKGSTLKALQANTQTRIMIFGRGSNRDKNKEEEMRNSGDPKYAHLNEDLHVYIEIHAYPVEAQGRFTHVLNELKKFLDPNHPGYIETDMEGRARTGGPMRPPMRPPPPGLRGPPPLQHKRPRPPPPGPRYAPRPPPQAAAPPPDYYYQGAPPAAHPPYQGGGYGETIKQERDDYSSGGRRGGQRSRASRFEAPVKQEVKTEDYSYYPEQQGQSDYGGQSGGNLGYAQYPSQQEYSGATGGYENDPGVGGGGGYGAQSAGGGGYAAPPSGGGGYAAPASGGGGYGANSYSQGASQNEYAGYETGWENASGSNGPGGGKAPGRGFAAPKKPRPSPYAQPTGY